MAAQRFKFKLFTSADPDAQYTAVTTKDPLTFYLLNNGKGYLGNTKLFDATDSGITIASSIANDATGNTTEAASTKAVVDYVTAKVSGLGVLTDKFFRAVKSHTITAEDLTNAAISVPNGTQAGDVGLLFTSDNDNADGNEQYYFVSLKNYLSAVYTFGDTKSITFTTDENNNVTANVKISDGETGLVADETGLHLVKVDTINEDNPTNKLVTEDKMVSYVQNNVLPAVDTAVTEALKNVVTFEVDGDTGSGDSDGSDTTSGDSEIGTFNGKKLYRVIVNHTTPKTDGGIAETTLGDGHGVPDCIVECVNIYGTIIDGEKRYPINFSDGNNYVQVYIEGTRRTNMSVNFNVKGNKFLNKPIMVVIEYVRG